MRIRSLFQRVVVPLFFPILLVPLAGCNALSATPIAWSLTPSAVAAQKTLPSPVASPTQVPPTPFIRSTDTPNPNIPSAPGPWVVTLRGDMHTLVAMHPDGSGKQTISSPDPLLYPSDLSQGASPASPYLAVRTGQPDLTNLSLALVSLTDGKIQPLAPLLTEQIQQQVLQRKPEEFMPEAATAVTLPDSLAWSPNGRYLAYVGAGDGPSADLYLYDTKNGQIRRLTSGLNQAISPIWSPDSLWIITTEVMSFNPTSGWRLTRVWAAAVDHNETRLLYAPPANSVRELPLGWIGKDTLVMYTQAPDSARDVREVPVSARRIGRIYAGPALQVAFDPTSGLLTFTQDELTGPQLGLAPGLYSLANPKSVPHLVQAGEWHDLHWSPEAKRFFASGSAGLISFNPSGDAFLYKNEVHVATAPSGLWVVCWGTAADPQPGLRLYQPGSQPLQTVTTRSVQQVIWQTDSKAFWYLSNGKLYRAAFPSAQAALLEEDLAEGSLAWVGAAGP